MLRCTETSLSMMKKITRLTVATSLASLLFAGSSAAAPPTAALRLTIQPQWAQAPAEFHARIRVERHPANRILEYSVDGDSYSQSSNRQMDGDAAPAIYDVWLKVPCGRYVMVVRVYRTDHQVLEQREPFEVMGAQCE
jgi:hypothetical protein